MQLKALRKQAYAERDKINLRELDILGIKAAGE